MVFPWMSERGFPGRRVDAKRAGMIATMANRLQALGTLHRSRRPRSKSTTVLRAAAWYPLPARGRSDTQGGIGRTRPRTARPTPAVVFDRAAPPGRPRPRSSRDPGLRRRRPEVLPGLCDPAGLRHGFPAAGGARADRLLR